MLVLTGKQFGRLTVLGRATRKDYWRCRCACGALKKIRSDSLRANGGTRSCGCLQREAVKARGYHHQRGERFSRLVIIELVGTIKKRGRVYLCLCDCGKKVKVQGRFLRAGTIKSCGCWYRATRMTTIRHGQARASGSTPTWRAYRRQKSQCQNPRCKQAKYFLERGIKFLFSSFAEFYADVGDKPHDDYWLVRKNNSGHFEPGNLEWRKIKRHPRKRRRKFRS